MKKEVILLLILILALSAYLVFQKTDKVTYELPKIPAISKKDITRIEIQKPDETLTITKTGDDWHVGEKLYAVDSRKMEGIFSSLDSFALTAMVSEAKNYERYDLSNEKKIHVQVWENKDLKLDFDLGKTAGTHRHTFVKMADDDRVYHARGNFRNNFNVTLEALRDKQVMKFDAAAIRQVALTDGNQTLELALESVPAQAFAHATDIDKKDADGAGQPPDENKPVLQWHTKDGKAVDAAAMDRLFSQLSDLRCQKYVYDKTKADLTDPIYTIVLEGAQEYRVSVFDKGAEEKNEYPAISSMTDDPFVLPKWQAEKIMVKFDELLNPAKKEADQTEK